MFRPSASRSPSLSARLASFSLAWLVAALTAPLAQATTVTQTFVATDSTRIHGDNQANNVTAIQELVSVGKFGANDNQRANALLHFGGVNSLEYDSIESITLTLYYAPHGNNSVTDSFSLEVHQIAGGNQGWTTTATWSNKVGGDSPTPWVQNPTDTTWGGGANYHSPVLASVSVNTTMFSALNHFDAIEFVFTGTSDALTALIDDWQTTNAGLLVRGGGTIPGSNRLFFFSSYFDGFPYDGGTTPDGAALPNGTQASDFLPTLTITYTPMSVIPEPSTWALLGVGAAGMALVLRRRRQ